MGDDAAGGSADDLGRLNQSESEGRRALDTGYQGRAFLPVCASGLLVFGAFNESYYNVSLNMWRVT